MRRRSTNPPRRSRAKHRWLSLIAVLSCLVACAFTVLVPRLLLKPRGLAGTLDVSYAIIDLSHGKFRVAPAIADNGESFSSMMYRIKPYAAITGTYYDEHDKPMGDIVMASKVVSRGAQRQGIGFTRNRSVRFLERKGSARLNWEGCESGFACGPRLVRAGKVDIQVKKDGFSAVAARREATRCAVGLTRKGQLILCTVKEPITLVVLGRLMLELGAQDAINCDGGSMCALYKDGVFYAEPQTPMNNVLAVYRR